jgi:hypothetical protein
MFYAFDNLKTELAYLVIRAAVAASETLAHNSKRKNTCTLASALYVQILGMWR